MVNRLYSAWSLVASWILQESILGPVLCNNFVSDLEMRDCSLIRSVSDCKAGEKLMGFRAGLPFTEAKMGWRNRPTGT